MTLSVSSPATIRILPDELVNKIAAGEVVERPLNVVKELVENAIDAGATALTIEVKDGGRAEIVVVDNGSGMTATELKLALLAHATSKIQSFADLFAIQSLGFRGEALPAIAAVSRLTLTSRTAGSESAYCLQLDGGKIVEEGPTGHAPGTRVEVRNLFFNTPARLKFMKSTATEWSHLVDYVQRAALSHPEIAFSLSHNGKSVLAIHECSENAHRLAQIFDTEMAKQGIFFEKEGLRPTGLRGWLGFPDLSHKSPSGLYFFVNGRPIRDRVIQHAVMEAYQGLVMKGRYPVVILHLAIPPSEVDVNVHPTKSELRFQNSQTIHQQVWKSLRGLLQTQPWIERRERGTVAALPISPALSQFNWNRSFHATLPLPPTNRQTCEPASKANAAVVNDGEIDARPSRIPYTELTLIGQLHGTYLLCESGAQLILVDQHAAHERVGFEALKKAYAEERLRPEPLLLPFPLELLPADAAILEAELNNLERLGLEISHVGSQSFAIQAVPTLLAHANWTELMNDLIADLKGYGQSSLLDAQIDDLLATMACHRQIRANDRLSREEMQALLVQLGEVDFAYHCPHGRPAAVEISLSDIEKWFKRKI